MDNSAFHEMVSDARRALNGMANNTRAQLPGHRKPPPPPPDRNLSRPWLPPPPPISRMPDIDPDKVIVRPLLIIEHHFWPKPIRAAASKFWLYTSVYVRATIKTIFDITHLKR